MDSVSPVNELEQQLKETGQHLTSVNPSSINNLLQLLDKTKQLLTRVGQAPSVSMQKALVPSMGALISDELIKHSDTDVRISVASCLCEVARITAPEQSYKDEVMKEIFRLNVFAFEQLSNVTGQSYEKVVYIIQSVAKVKSCLIMLDLECDELILEMFELFLSKIRSDHPYTVFSDIETIMTLIIEESDEVATQLLSLLISHVKKENQNVSPASWKIAEKVLRNCSDTLKPYHETIKKLVNSNFDDYADVVTLLCQNAYENEHVVTRSTLKSNSAHKRDHITTENGGSTKKQKFIDNNQFKGKEFETPKRGRPRKNKIQDKKKSSKTKSNIKNSGSSDDGSRGKDIPKKSGQDLVGHSIKVWWPLDKAYYKGVVASYDPLDKKHRVLYADGDEELLDLSQEKWKMLDEILPDQQQGKTPDMPTAIITLALPHNQKGKENLESSPTLEDNSSSPKSPPPADSSKTMDVIGNVDNQKDNLVPTPANSYRPALTEKTVDNQKGKGNLESSLTVEDNSGSSKSPPRADSSKTMDVDNQNDNLLPTPANSYGLALTEKTVDNVEKNGESGESGELQEKSLLQSSETTQRLEKTDNLVGET